MAVQETSKIALEKLKESPVTQDIFKAILDIGPTHNNRILEYLIQKEKQKPRRERRKWEISYITGRVHDLIHKHCLVRDIGPHRGIWHGKSKTYHIWAVVGDERGTAGWRPVPKGDIPKPRKHPAKIRAGIEQVREKVEKKIVNTMEYAPAGRRKTTVQTNQPLLFSKT
ncbi:MAG: hypothetical protein GWN55_16610 [Phycisphaerae bacterium]|nr:hypothetical protein [Phycisphaerae bacterium]NIS22538.1 hypothetical protein [candidate division KSB1 bacterium]NIP55110.1 hypothetical protein [Phycisphaerae bacterium]NIS49732.1 hypothetical protein [Phycisphaerae bacterium]NIU28765.1 hypothetical protein [candidate division KSB1 bacterium]